LLQYAETDEFVSRDERQPDIRTFRKPKTIRICAGTDRALNAQARLDRYRWLRRRIRIDSLRLFSSTCQPRHEGGFEGPTSVPRGTAPVIKTRDSDGVRHLVDAGGKLPVMIIFVDTDEHVNRVLPVLKEMATHRLIVRKNVVLEPGNLN
jgi:PII-like signaling protein